MMKKLPLIAIVGCTGTGKSKLAVELAKQFNGEVINGDAMQIYRGLPIATNKITHAEMEGIRHHLLDCRDNDRSSEEYTVKSFVTDCLNIIGDIHSRDKLPIVVGGTHYYIQSLLWEQSLVEESQFVNSGCIDDALRQEIQSLLSNETDSEILFKKLETIDPEMAQKWHRKDYRKIRRSLQVYLETGHRHSEIIKSQRAFTSKSRFETLVLCLGAEMSRLDGVLDVRVDDMLSRGLLDELEQFWSVTDFDHESIDYTRGILQTIGLKEFHDYFRDKNRSTDSQQFRESLEKMKIATRRYARKQIKWIRNLFVPNLAEHPHTKFYVMECEDRAKWSDQVLEPSRHIVSLFTNSSEKYPDPKSICERYTHYLSNFASLMANKKEWRKHRCDICDIECNGPREWSEHLGSKRHRKALTIRSSPQWPHILAAKKLRQNNDSSGD